MKKFLLVSVLVGVLVLTGCSMQKGLSQDELFEKKIECNKLRKQMEEDLENKLPINNDEDLTVYLHEIFYSTAVNSCLYYGERKGNSSYDYIIVDYLNNKKLVEIYGYDIGIKSDRGYEILIKKLKELKGE